MTLKVGVTGGIGSGKSIVCSIIETLGYPVFNADIEAKKISESNPMVVNAISTIFGNDIYIAGKLDRKRIATLVFNNKELLNSLNGIIHPAVAIHFQDWTRNHSNFPFVFEEAAILFESGANKQIDKSIIVTAPVELRIQRVVNRDGVTPSDVIKRMSNQLPESELIKMADFVIYNDGNNLVLSQVLEIIEKLKKF